MKYDILDELKLYLNDNFTENTSKRYYSAVKNLFKDLKFSKIGEIKEEEIVSRLKKVKSKNDFSAAKNGLLQLKKIQKDLNLPSSEVFKDIALHKRNWVKSRGRTVDLDKMLRKVNSLKNDKLKLAYRLALISGLRVSELSSLKAEDISFTEGNRIQIHVRHGKGEKEGTVVCLPDEYVESKMKKYCENLDSQSNLFYSKSYMGKRAWELNIEMHDFRRAYAKLKKNACLSNGLSNYEANEETQKGLRHTRFSTTKYYLYGRKITTNNKKYGINRAKKEDRPNETRSFEPLSEEYYAIAAAAAVANMNDAEKAAIRDYASNGYIDINKFLSDSNYICSINPEEVKAKISILDDILNHSPLNKNCILYRGTVEKEIFGQSLSGLSADMIKEKFENSVIEYKSFISTSCDKDVPLDFILNKTSNPVLMQIEAPGSINGIFFGDVSPAPQEQEVLLEREIFLKIESINTNYNKNFCFVEARIIGKGKK